MKTIYSMGRGKYIHLDSYGETPETRRWSVGIALFSVIIAAITISALVGVDITQINSQYTQQQTNEAQ
jgi:hypothetical protein